MCCVFIVDLVRDAETQPYEWVNQNIFYAIQLLFIFSNFSYFVVITIFFMKSKYYPDTWTTNRQNETEKEYK